MPNRIIRDSLLDSDRWIELHDNTARVCYIVLLLSIDDVGNMEASPPRLRRLWSAYGLDTDAKVSAVLETLVGCDLIRVYNSHDKRHIHVPRFRQILRHVKRRVCGSPWDDAEKIQAVAEKTLRERDADAQRTPIERLASAMPIVDISTNENIQGLAKKTLRERTANATRPLAEVKRSEVKLNRRESNRSEVESNQNQAPSPVKTGRDAVAIARALEQKFKTGK